jgi:hypothetical protein
LYRGDALRRRIGPGVGDVREFPLRLAPQPRDGFERHTAAPIAGNAGKHPPALFRTRERNQRHFRGAVPVALDRIVVFPAVVPGVVAPGDGAAKLRCNEHRIPRDDIERVGDRRGGARAQAFGMPRRYGARTQRKRAGREWASKA